MAIFLRIIEILCTVLTTIILLRVIVSWYISPTNAFFRFLRWLTEPILAPLRRVIPRLGSFDFSPLVAVVLIQLIYHLLARLLLLTL